jgi:hypothetical protein
MFDRRYKFPQKMSSDPISSRISVVRGPVYFLERGDLLERLVHYIARGVRDDKLSSPYPPPAYRKDGDESCYADGVVPRDAC